MVTNKPNKTASSPQASAHPREEHTAVRKYLEQLNSGKGDTPRLRNPEGRLQKMKDNLAVETDATKRLAIREDIRQLEARMSSTGASSEDFVNGFIQHGKSYAVRKGISAASFRAEGVPAAVLKQAGIK